MEDGAIGAQAMRQTKGLWRLVIASTAICLSLFQLYTGAFGTYTAMIQRGVHIAFILALVFLVYPMSRKCSRSRIDPWDVLLAVAGFGAGAYIVVNYEELVLREGAATQMDVYTGILTILLVLEATRRTVGLPVVIISVLFLAYALLGPMFPDAIAHRGYSLDRVSYQMYLTTSGILGTPLGVSSTIIYMFVLFGAVLEKCGAGDLFINFANAVVGWTRGGMAKASIISSSLFGTVSGSAVANVAVDGWLTIPMMVKSGFRPHIAGAIEAVASTGGQIMPPVMGAAAFIMAEITNIPYIQIAASAAIPAILYYAAAFFVVDMEAAKTGLKPLSRSEMPSLWRVLAQYGHVGIPLVVLVFLMAQGYSPMLSAFWTIALTIPVSMLRKHTRLSPRGFIEILEKAAMNMLSVASICACAGIIIGVITLTGLGLKLSSLLIGLAGGNLFALLVLTMIASLILGMGVPTAACYILLATLVAPALTGMGIPVIAAHLFIFYFGCISVITPPVALAAYAAAGLAGTDPNRTGFAATRIAMAGYIVPYMFVYGPAMLLVGSPVEVVIALCSGLLGCYALAAAIQGYLLIRSASLVRAVLFVAALLLIKPGWETDLIGVVLLLGAAAFQAARRRTSR